VIVIKGSSYMNIIQPGILAEGTKLARYLDFSIKPGADIIQSLQVLSELSISEDIVIALGQPLLDVLGKNVPGLTVLEPQSVNGIDIPSTPAALWCWIRGDDRGEIFHRSRQLEAMLVDGFSINRVIDSFQYDANRDLSGYEDGTENPQGDAAIEAGIVQGQGAGLDGSSFVAVQQWLHDFNKFDSMTIPQQDDVIGRHISDNEEFDEAPESAHVKRAAQESFQPEAFMLRRSMPWSEGMAAGLVFVAFGSSFNAFEAVLSRMLGKQDSICDALFDFTRPVSGAYFWCPPVSDGKLDLSVLDL
jgi:putative iron-dependent peroxidase